MAATTAIDDQVLEAIATGEAFCVVCGCTDEYPCPGGCWWIGGADMLDRCCRCKGKAQVYDDRTGRRLPAEARRA